MTINFIHEGDHPDQVHAICHFDKAGVYGTVHLLQHRYGAAYTKLHFILDGLDELPGDLNYGSGDDEYGVAIY